MKKLLENIKTKINKNKRAKMLLMGGLSFLILLLISGTVAWFAAQDNNNSEAKLKVITKTTDYLSFLIEKDLYIDVNDYSLALGKGNLRDSTKATALLRANNSNNMAEYKYWIYLKININSLGYTTEEETPELLLKVKDPEGNYLENITGLKYVTVGGESGFDVTTTTGVLMLAEDTITTTSTETKEWEIELVFINLETDQVENTGKEFDANIMMQKEEYKIPEVYVSTTYNNKVTAPDTVGPTVTFSCNNNTSTYNYRYNRLEINEMNGQYSMCSLNFADRENKNYLNELIISLSGKQSGDGNIVNENGYRYEGKAPDNYIWFNNQMWRIIGVFDSSSHGVANTNLVKILKADTIGGYTWDKTNSNNWASSSLYKLLNDYYYNATDGTGTGYCYMHQSNLTRECNFGDVGIQSGYRKMIKNVTWYLGGYSSNELLSDNTTKDPNYYASSLSKIYELERSNNIPSGNQQFTKGHIGLMYGSDYGYSVPSSCTQRDLGHIHNNACAGSSWIYGAGYEWLLTPLYDNNTDVMRINYNGYASPNAANLGREVRPTLYLDESVYVISGTGTITDPYIIGM